MSKFEVRLWKLGEGGGIDLIVKDNLISESARMVISGGTPF